MHNISNNTGENLHQTLRTHKLLRSASFALRHLKNNKKNVHIILIGNSLTRTRVHISLSVSVLVSMCVTCARPVRPTKTATFGRGFTTEPTNSGLPSFCVTCLLRHFIMICGLRHVLSSNVAVRAWHCLW